MCNCISFSSENISKSNSIYYGHGKKQSYFQIQPLYGRNWWGTLFSNEYIFDIEIITLTKKSLWGKGNSCEFNLHEANLTWALL